MSLNALLDQIRSCCEDVPEAFVLSPDYGVKTRPAAVIVPILEYADHATILLTKRTSHLTAHAGQICFPGGVREETDADLLATALRECEEELGISPDALTIIGEGRGRITATGYHITPFFAHISAPLTYSPDPNEIEMAFELPLPMALRRNAYQKVRAEYQGVTRTHDVLNYDGHCIWGATAGILRDLCRMVYEEQWEEATC
jgi:8-oxo-dGTP pyrophosphatase MutT (NUDIX family)